MSSSFVLSVFIFLFVTIASYRNAAAESQLSPIVETVNGKIQGGVSVSRNGKEFYAFRGIPYAKPPVGDLRFEPPEPAESWEGVKNTSTFGSKCIQYDRILDGVVGEEECLFLNVFTPKSTLDSDSGGALPVLVWVHGGFFLYGSASSNGPEYFMDHPLILVTINYRLASMGFLNTGDGVIRGNMGLKDQNMALRWVQENIKHFGGNPDKVTLLGNSAGGASVSFHLLSPMSKGLFHKAISHSGSSIKLFSLATRPAAQAKRLAKKLNCSRSETGNEIAHCLKSLDAAEIVAIHREELYPLVDSIKVFAPSIEATHRDEPDTFLSEHPYKILTEGRAHRIPYITGLNSEEGLYYNGRIMKIPHLISLIENNWDDVAPQLLHYDPSRTDVTAKIRDFYKLGFAQTLNYFQEFPKITKILSDRMYNAATSELGRIQSQFSPVYMYYYNYHGVWQFVSTFSAHSVSGEEREVIARSQALATWWKKNIVERNPPSFGVSHADELSLFFNYTGSVPIGPGSKDYEMSMALVSLWVQFANDEQPMSFYGHPWTPVNGSAPALKYLEIADNGSQGMIDEPMAANLQFWKSMGIEPFEMNVKVKDVIQNDLKSLTLTPGVAYKQTRDAVENNRTLTSPGQDTWSYVVSAICHDRNSTQQETSKLAIIQGVCDSLNLDQKYT